ncbi:MAG: ATP-binding cassette domain-containing protein [Thermoplasmata archaeon]
MGSRTISLECLHVSKRRRGIDLVRDVSFREDRGGVVALTGPSRSGKSTLLLMIAGLIHQTSGLIQVQGRTVADPTARQFIGSAVGDPTPYDRLSVLDTLDLAGELRGMSRVAIRERIYYLDSVLALPPLGTIISNLPSTQRRRVMLAVSLIADPPVLLWDEPAALADEEDVRRIETLVRSLSVDHLILLGTRSTQLAAHVARRVLVLNRGALVYDGPNIEFGTLLPFRRVEVTFDQPVAPERVASVLPLAFHLTVVNDRVFRIRFLHTDPKATSLLQHLLPVGRIVDFRDLPTDWSPPPPPPMDRAGTATQRAPPLAPILR